jgi:hypothetical protein
MVYYKVQPKASGCDNIPGFTPRYSIRPLDVITYQDLLQGTVLWI